VSKIATDVAKPNGERYVPKPEVLIFLEPLSIKKIPGIGDKTFHLLRSMGIVTIGTLRQIPQEMMEKVLGKNGIILWEKANGIDNTPVQPYSEQKSMSSERTFEQDTIDVNYMNRVLVGMVEKLAFDLRKNVKLTSCITVKIRYSNFDTFTLQKKIPYTVFDHVLIAETKELFKRLYQRRMLIRLIGVKFSNMVYGTQQLNMFEDTPEMVNLYRAMDSIRRRYGSHALYRAGGMRDEK
jgi:DNA polymerase-4